MQDQYEIIPFDQIENIQCETVKEADLEEINKIGEKLSYTCAMLKGEGLSASQVGIKKRMFVYRINEKVFKLILNPRYVPSATSKRKVVEGCLSYTKKYIIKRLKHVTAIYQSYNAEKKIFVDERQHLYGKEAIIFQHETDHCGNGEGNISRTIRMIGEEI